MVFNLLTSVGLRENHRLLDIGCGSLRCGRLLIPYLNSGNYFGVEPNKWLVQAGLRNEIGKDILRIKRPTFSFAADLAGFDPELRFDFAVAQSIFSHCGTDLINGWLAGISHHLKDDGALFATFLAGTEDFQGSGWIYPANVPFRPDTIKDIAARNGLAFEVIPWRHPVQTWGIFTKANYDRSLIAGGNISWNRALERARAKPPATA